jgi:dihydrofolate reductase
MNKPVISAIVAISLNRVIGKDQGIPWHIPGEQKRFKEITMGHPMIMGRKTHESIGRPLPGRENIVITRDLTYNKEGVTVVHSLEEALNKAKELDQEEIFIIGGAQIYSEAITQTDRLYLTTVQAEVTGDTYFPEFENEFTKVTHREELEAAELKYTFEILEKE